MTDAPDPFINTRWTLVLRAQGSTPEARAALSELCEAYYEPIFQFLRREGRDAELAKDLAHTFFAQLLSQATLAPDRSKGRFRSYLLGAVKHFLADERKHRQRAKRGSGQTPQSLDDPDTDQGLLASSSKSQTPDAWFDRQWALNVMRRGLNTVEQEWTAKGKQRHFSTLKQWLETPADRLSYADAANTLGWSESATKVSVHRLRKQFRTAIKKEIADTLPPTGDVQAELRYLIEVLSAPPSGDAE